MSKLMDLELDAVCFHSPIGWITFLVILIGPKHVNSKRHACVYPLRHYN